MLTKIMISNRIRFFFVNNIAQKILAISLAFFIWLLASAPERQEKTIVQFNIPLTNRNLPNSLEVVSQNTHEINIAVEVSKHNSQVVHPSFFQAFLDLTNAKEGNNIFSISEDNFKM